MVEKRRLIFIHGLEGTSRGVKAILLRGLFPDMLIPDFTGSLEERMADLYSILGEEDDWTIVYTAFSVKKMTGRLWAPVLAA